MSEFALLQDAGERGPNEAAVSGWHCHESSPGRWVYYYVLAGRVVYVGVAPSREEAERRSVV